MGSVEKRLRDGKTTWLARWRDPDGRQRKRSFERRVDAQRYLTASAAMTLDVYAALWDDELDGVSERLDALVPPRRPIALIQPGDDEAAGA